MFDFPATVVGLVDGDTVFIDLPTDLRLQLPTGDLELRVTQRRLKCRLARINAIELKELGGKEALAWLRDKVQRAGGSAVIRSATGRLKRDKYGRVLVELWVGGCCMNDALVEAGLAQRVYGEDAPEEVEWLPCHSGGADDETAKLCQPECDADDGTRGKTC